jgi:glutamine synthetase adenylyltransferase
MEGEDDFQVEYSTEELVQLVQDGEHILDSMEEDPLIVDSSDDESKVVKVSDAQKYAKDVLNFMASQGSQIFNTQELLGKEKIHDKLIRIGVGHLTSLKQCDIGSFFVCSERSLPDLNDTL